MAAVEDSGKRAELIFGIVAAVGTPVTFVTNTLADELRKSGYTPEVLHLSSYTKAVKLETPWPEDGTNEYTRISNLMKRGNELREKSRRGEILANFAGAKINSMREGVPARALRDRAFILRQLKHPDEVQRLRQIYGDGFHTLGIYCPKDVRRTALHVHGGMSPEEATDLIDRDENEPPSLGQKFRDTFYLADVFIEALTEKEAATKSQIHRFLNLLLGRKIIAPRRDEYGMYLAHAAALRSASLARQVGAAILAKTGEVLALGSNEVPRYGGGQYWEEEVPDGRDHARGIDPSDAIKSDIVGEIMQNLDPDWSSRPEQERSDRIRNAMVKLKTTRIMNLTEFTRAVHAEMEAITSAARVGISICGATLYTTAFPCHGCAKHIVGAGIERLVYIEPYPKSLAMDLHNDSICVENRCGNQSKVKFEPFVGVGPRRYADFFSSTTKEGARINRKDGADHVVQDDAGLRLSMSDTSYVQRESEAAQELKDFTGKL